MKLRGAVAALMRLHLRNAGHGPKAPRKLKNEGLSNLKRRKSHESSLENQNKADESKPGKAA